MFFSILLLAHIQAAVIPIILGFKSINKFTKINKSKILPVGFISLGLASICEMIEQQEMQMLNIRNNLFFITDIDKHVRPIDRKE